jgi:ADP-ribose pyrophosphatase YjhB (NUDIX family)
VNVEGAVVRDGEYLLVRRAGDEEHASGLLGFPGGKVEQPPGCENSIEEIRDHPDAPPFLESYVDQIEAVRDGG